MSCARGEHPFGELADSALSHGDTIVSVIQQPDVTELALSTRVERGAVAGDLVAVQIEGDVVRTDDDAVVRAVDQVAVERCVGGDRVAAADMTRGRLTGAESDQPSHGQHEGHQRNAPRTPLERYLGHDGRFARLRRETHEPPSSLAALAHPTRGRLHLQAGYCFPCEAGASIRPSETLPPDELQACPPGVASCDGGGGADASVDGPSTLIWLGLRR